MAKSTIIHAGVEMSLKNIDEIPNAEIMKVFTDTEEGKNPIPARDANDIFRKIGFTQGQSDSLVAYRSGQISLGKFAECMNLPLLEARKWLADHDVPQNNAYRPQDAASA